jgi:hypothetical protein
MQRRPTRRWILTGAACLTHQAVAQTPTKVSRETAKYQDTPRGGQTCEACTSFRRPRACQVVEGDISPDGWCQLFDMPD